MRTMAFGLWIGALALGCGGSTFVPDDHDAGPSGSSTSGGSSTTSGGSGGGSLTSSTTATTTSGGTTTGGTTSSTTGGTTSSTTGSTTGSGGGSAGTGGSGTGGSSGGSAGTGGGSGGDAGVDWSQCSGPGQCSAQLTGCCGPCGMPTLDNFAGVNPMYTAAFRMATCPVPVPCPRCATAINPYIGALCGGTHCKAFDTRLVPEFSKCSTENDCRLRNGLDCCECGSQGPWTAVSIDGQAAINAAVCAPQTGCPDCAPVPPPGMRAVCVQGHCEVSTPAL
jgi:hypothetical protein